MGVVVGFPRDEVDYLDRDGATKLAAAITRYWFRHGYPLIDARVYEQHRQLRTTSGKMVSAPYWVVRSNVGPKGFPPRR